MDEVSTNLITPNKPMKWKELSLIRAQVQTLVTSPQMPEIRLTPQRAAHYVVMDYDKYFPLAPGMALIKAPGHTPGSQMVYIQLKSGSEYLLAGNVAWHRDEIRELRGKGAPSIKEQEDLVMAELASLNQVYKKNEKNVPIVLSHDESKEYV